MSQCQCNPNDDTPCETETGYATVEPFPMTPLSILIADRDGMMFIIDGRTDDTRISLSGLDPVSKAGLKVLFQQALRELEPPRATGGFVSGGITYPGWAGDPPPRTNLAANPANP